MKRYVPAQIALIALVISAIYGFSASLQNDTVGKTGQSDCSCSA